MEIFNIAIGIEDFRYGEAIAKVLGRKHSFLHFTNYDEDSSSAMENRKYDVMLSSDYQLKRSNSIIITNSIDEESLVEKSQKYIFKYRSSERYSKAIFDLIFENTGHQIMIRREKPCKVIAFAGISVSDFSKDIISLAHVMNRNEGKKIIYICFDSVCSHEIIAPEENSPILRMMYYLDVDKKFPIENFIHSSSDDIDYILDYSIPNLLCLGNQNNIIKIIREVISLGKYDYVFAYFGQNILSLLNESINKMNEVIYYSVSFSNEMYETDVRVIKVIREAIGKEHFFSIDEEENSFIQRSKHYLEECMSVNDEGE